MPEPRAFLSFDFDHDSVSRILFAGQAKKDSPTPFTVEDWSSKTVLDEDNWEALLAPKIRSTNMCIVLVGKHMGSAGGVGKEIAIAKAWDLPVFGVYVDGAGSLSTLPVGLARSRVVDWKWPQIAAMVDVCMTEGKNG
jgi:hypothetical protein